MISKTDLQVLILCGGRGERLKPLTEQVPKPLVEINGRPMLSYLLSYFKGRGMTKFVIAVGYKADVIGDFFQTHHGDLEVRLVDSGDADIIKRIQDALPHISGDFILCYGDTLADVDMPALIDYHHSHPAPMTITTYPLQSQFGVLEIEASGRVRSFVEKPVLDKWINIGYYYFARESFDYLFNYNNFAHFLKDVTSKGLMYGFKHSGIHITVNTITELQDAQRNITRFVDSNHLVIDG
jgi:glucose-1-phosphate cytidylyltransferase